MKDAMVKFVPKTLIKNKELIPYKPDILNRRDTISVGINKVSIATIIIKLLNVQKHKASNKGLILTSLREFFIKVNTIRWRIFIKTALS